MNSRFTKDVLSPRAPFLVLFVATLALLVGAYNSGASGSIEVPYPEGYRNWTHVKTMVVGPQSPFFQTGGGMHHICANEKAMEGYRTGHFLDGAVLVFDLRDTAEKEGTISEGIRKRVDVMLKDSKRFSSTGGWGFERFMGDTNTPTLTEEHKEECFTCHQQAKAHEFVFSVYRE